MAESPSGRIWTLRLFGLASPRLDMTISLLAVAVLAMSRFALLANGPWEQDEAIFARAVLHFEPALHFPHPPFFPGWIAMGKAVAAVTGDALLALQLLSSLACVLSLFPLAYLGRRVAPPAIAFVCAFGVQFLPGSWVFSVRGFNSIPAGFLLFLALAWIARGVQKRSLVGMALLLATAFTIRPVFAPLLVIVACAAVWWTRPFRRTIVPALLGGTLAAAAFFPVVWAVGGWAGFVHMLGRHGGGHMRSTGVSSWHFDDLGPVVALGGPWPAAGIAALCIVGLLVWGRKQGWRSSIFAGVLLASFVLYLLFVHVRTFPRYSAPLALGIAPLLAAAFSLVRWPALGAAVPAVGAAWLALSWYPAVVEQHRHQLPLWRAASWACEKAFVAPGLWQVLPTSDAAIFVAYADSLGRLRFPASRTPAPGRWAQDTVADPLAPHWYLVTGWEFEILGSDRTTEEIAFSDVSPRLKSLSQDRFLLGRVISDLPLKRGRWWPVETREDGRRLAWCSNRSVLILPGSPPGVFVQVGVSPAYGDKALVVSVNQKIKHTVAGKGGSVWLHLPARALYSDRPNLVVLDREEVYPPGGRDQRPLSARVLGIVSGRYEPFAVNLGDENAVRELGIDVKGFHGREGFRGGVIGRWSKERGVIGLPICQGELTMTMLAPRPGNPQVEIFVNGERAVGPVPLGVSPQSVRLEVSSLPETDPLVRVEVVAVPPLRQGRVGRERTLGVAVSDMAFTPRGGG